MSNKVQNINDITPMQGQQNVDNNDPAQKEYMQGKSMLERGEYAMAVASLHNALLGFEEKKNENGIANASNQLGIACFHKKEFEAALKHFKRAEDICLKIGDPMSLVALSKQFILVHSELEQYKEAIDRCLDLLDLYQANNDPRATVSTMELIVDVYLKKGDTQKAADAYRTIASIHKNFKHEKIADEYLQKAEDLEKEAGN